MAKFKLEVLHKVNDPAEARTLFDAETRNPKCVVMKRVGEYVTDYLVCVPYHGDTFDRIGDQMLSLDIPHREDVADMDAAEAARGGDGDIDGMTFEYANPDGSVAIYSDDGTFIHSMIAEPKNPPSVGGLRAEEGFAPPTQIKPTGQAFNDSQLGVDGAEAAGFGRELG